MDRPLEHPAMPGAAAPRATPRAATRTAVVWDALQPLLDSAGEGRVVDIGGGTGGFAVRVAGLGHRVTVVDPSPDALAALARRADEQGVADRVTGQQGDLADLLELVPAGSVDLVLCHGVLGLLDDPAAALRTLGEVLRPGGALSLLVGQRHAAVLARAMAGHLVAARELLEEGGPISGERRFTADGLTGLLAEAGFAVRSVHAVRVFTDLVPASLLELEPGAAAALLDLERAVSTRPEYLSLAAQLHVVATR
ncbi:MAG TPA: methyltransferase [Marmoricola sp.]|nr:methyltransferase [Marmoricola sp.]